MPFDIQQQLIDRFQTRKIVGQGYTPIVSNLIAYAQIDTHSKVIGRIHVQIRLFKPNLVIHTDMRIEFHHRLLNFLPTVLIVEEVIQSTFVIGTSIVVKCCLFAAPEHAGTDVEIETAVVPGGVVEGDRLTDLFALRYCYQGV